MRRLLLGMFAFTVGLSPLIARQQAPAVPAPKATVTGSVLRSSSGEPVSRATVTMTRVGPQGPRGGAPQGQAGQRGQAPAQQQPQVFTATTDDQGKFRFTDVDEGPYRIIAARNGFARQEYGQRSFNRPGTVVNIRAGQQVTDVAFRLTAASTLSGRVLDSLGEPQPGVTVQVLRSTYDATGKRTLQPAGSARTNDLGEYRMYWINPGRYLVSANAARSTFELITAGAAQAAGQAQNPAQAQQAAQAAAMFGAVANPNEVSDSGLGLTYYPGTPEASRALAVDLQPGEEVRGIDFTLIRTQRVRISGRVVDTTTGLPPQNAAVSVSLRDATGSSPLDALLGGADPTGANRYNSATGEFVVANVANGSYWLQVISQGAATPVTPTPDAPPTTQEALNVLNSINSARIPIDVYNADIANLTLNVGPGMSISGHVQIEGGQPANVADLQRIGIQLQSSSGGGNILALIQGGVVRAAADGSFSIPRITPGDYRLVVSGTGTNLYVKQARLGQTDVLSGVTISEPLNGNLEIVLRMNPGQVTGNVVDATLKPIGAVQAVLVPEQLRGRQDLYKTAVTDQEGRFTFRGVAPGDYRVFAWEDIEPFSYFDPGVIKQYEAAGKLVHIQESSNETTEVRLIPAAN